MLSFTQLVDLKKKIMFQDMKQKLNAKAKHLSWVSNHAYVVS